MSSANVTERGPRWAETSATISAAVDINAKVDLPIGASMNPKL